MLEENNNYCSQKGEINESKNIKTLFFSREKYEVQTKDCSRNARTLAQYYAINVFSYPKSEKNRFFFEILN
jgi:hypothetical protein